MKRIFLIFLCTIGLSASAQTTLTLKDAVNYALVNKADAKKSDQKICGLGVPRSRVSSVTARSMALSSGTRLSAAARSATSMPGNASCTGVKNMSLPRDSMCPTLVMRQHIVETHGDKMAKCANCGAFVSVRLIGFSASGASLLQFCATRMLSLRTCQLRAVR